MMGPFAKIFDGFQSLIIFEKTSTFYVRLGSKYASRMCPKLISKNISTNPFWYLALETLLAIAIAIVCSKIQCSLRSSCLGVFCKNLVLKEKKNYKIQRKTPVPESFLIELQAEDLKLFWECDIGFFVCICKSSNNTFLLNPPGWHPLSFKESFSSKPFISLLQVCN